MWFIVYLITDVTVEIKGISARIFLSEMSSFYNELPVQVGNYETEKIYP
jgi:hypothetical protein